MSFYLSFSNVKHTGFVFGVLFEETCPLAFGTLKTGREQRWSSCKLIHFLNTHIRLWKLFEETRTVEELFYVIHVLTL